MAYAVLLALWLSLSTGAPAVADTPPEAAPPDLSQVARLVDQRHQPMLLLITDPDCTHCLRLEREVLAPLRQSGTLEGRAILREMRLDTSGKLVDFDGERVRARVFLNRYQIFAVPTVLFLDQTGKPLHEPLVGYNEREAYLPMLEDALQASTALLRRLHASARGNTMVGSNYR